MENFETTEKKAEVLAKAILRQQYNVKSLRTTLVVHSFCQCGCGVTSAVYIDAKIKGEWVSQAVGVCKQCAE